MDNILSNTCRFWFSFLICFISSNLVNGSILQAVELPTDPGELAEYHFNLAQAYEAWSWIDNAHLHYEIVHDCFSRSAHYTEATNRMIAIRGKPRHPNATGIVGFCSGFGRCPESERRIKTATLNPRTFMDLNMIWPENDDKSNLGVTGIPQSTTTKRRLETKIAVEYPFEAKTPEWSQPGTKIPWLTATPHEWTPVQEQLPDPAADTPIIFIF